MHAVIWNPQARQNLLTIKAFYQESGVEVKIIEELLEGIFTATERLSDHPLSGRIVPEIANPNFREVIWNKTWRIIYMTPNKPEDPVEIMNVLHAARKIGG